MRDHVEDYLDLLAATSTQLANYVQQSRDGSGLVLQQEHYRQLANTLDLTKYIREGGLGQRADYDEWFKTYLDNSQHMHHPHYMGHQVAVPHLSQGVADLIAGTINNPMALYEMGPSAAVIEHVVINWMLSKIGWHDGEDLASPAVAADGVLTHGGSMANLTALLAARAAISPDAWQSGNPGDLVIIGSEVAHYSISRALGIMGMGSSALATVLTDNREVLLADDLPRVWREANDAGKVVMAVVANACATSTGLYDPITEIGHFCQEHGLWFHIDGAHGASALASPVTKRYMQDSHLADSMIWDTHKMLRTSTLAAAVLFKDRTNMAKAFDQKGSYLFHEKEQQGVDTMAYTVECTKASLGTKLFWSLAAEGEDAVGDFVASRYDLARQFAELLETCEDFTTPYQPHANILCFRFDPAHTNEEQLALRNRIVSRGSYYITSTEVQGIRYLRTVLINPYTTMEHLSGLVQEVRQVWQTLQS